MLFAIDLVELVHCPSQILNDMKHGVAIGLEV